MLQCPGQEIPFIGGILMSETIAFQITLDKPYHQAVEKVTAALKEEGFGVLTEIDVKATLKEKLDQDFEPYVILGACNPPLAHLAMTSEPLVGLLLPCNVTVREVEGGSEVSIINPSAILSMDTLKDNPGVRQVADEAHERLQRVAASLKR
jgi:uncharacterized protein (DUF302 family)